MEKGLSDKKAYELLKKYGFNELRKTKKKSALKIFISQFTSPLILLLIGVALVSFLMGFLPEQESNIFDVVLILIIVLASGIAGFFQDYKAEKTIEALQRIATPTTKVIRNGKEKEISINFLVPGDLIVLEGGDIVPADAKLVEAFSFQVDESTLTGESTAIKKKAGEEIYKGTFVNSGIAKAIVLNTGMHTKMGQIAQKLQEIEREKTPFQKEIASFTKAVIYSILGIILVLFIFSLTKYSLYDSLLTSISLAVAAIPEGLPAILVLVLAIGAKVMASRNALVRRLNIVESIGAVDIICTDKTGTLTKNEMKVTEVFFDNRTYTSREVAKNSSKFKELLECGMMCNNTREGYKDGKKIYFGEQTEIALTKFAESILKHKPKYKKVSEISFTSKRKMMSSIYKVGEGKFKIFSKGAPEVLIQKCDRILLDGKVRKLTKKEKEEIMKENKEFASRALRVLGFAYNEGRTENLKEKNLIWLGLQAMIDLERPEVKWALRECRNAGIRTIMLTGDNPLTAKAIADKIGLKTKEVLTGKDVERLDEAKLAKKLEEGVNIFARISPFHKYKILKVLKKKYRVAMTGDGVNDALALKKADVGIAVGRGTEVAKQASDIILLDNNFATIVTAVQEGRRSFDNIRKFINYLFVSNFAEVAVLFFATLFITLKLPILLPIQILWINLLTDGFPALALGLDPARPNIMKEPPRKKDEPILNKRLGWLILIIGLKKTLLLFAVFFLSWNLFNINTARTVLFTGFILYEFVRIGVIRTQEHLGWWSNKWLLFALGISLILQVIIIYTPLNAAFHIVPLGKIEWAILLTGTFLGYFLALFLTKIVMKFT